MVQALTLGVDHVGLTVADLEASTTFFCDCLGWTQVGENASYPAKFVSDGKTRVTLWQVGDRGDFSPFDRRGNIGLHHLAFKVADLDRLHELHGRVAAWPGVRVEFAPELLGEGPRVHSMVYEPGGNRIEFVFDPR